MRAAIRSLIIIAGLFASTAYAAPFDYLIAFPSEAAAQADPVVNQFWISSSDGSIWRADICFPSILAWDSTKDSVNTDGTVTHAPFDAKWLMICSFTTRQPELEAEATTHLVVDRGAGAVPAAILYSWADLASLATLMLQPTPSGAQYPFGNP